MRSRFASALRVRVCVLACASASTREQLASASTRERLVSAVKFLVSGTVTCM